ncbi:hypothetical protein R5R35_010899 [Gryllus longicercus]|uniref:Centriolar and ciliogenesis-associated protein HYLS1 C-terminal domain-containing protein n=1 Tax=Gryllus longicercus TaxID=2509291 RepID=A0AAN9Z0Q2_9ORTH
MSVRVEPQEVLAYLNRMGFCHVTAEQLKAFIKDLKKLIKHDLRQCKCSDKRSCDESCTTTSNSDSYFHDNRPCSSHKENECMKLSSCTSEQDETDYSCTSSEKSESDEENRKQMAEVQFIERKKQSKIQKVTDRPRSSFIKPWQLQMPATHRRTDPVALYHKYQSMWQQQKVPGDDGRIGLRWHVREKMLGVDPHPRPVPRAPSVERIAKHRPGCSSLRLI